MQVRKKQKLELGNQEERCMWAAACILHNREKKVFDWKADIVANIWFLCEYTSFLMQKASKSDVIDTLMRQATFKNEEHREATFDVLNKIVDWRP